MLALMARQSTGAPTDKDLLTGDSAPVPSWLIIASVVLLRAPTADRPLAASVPS